MSRINRFFVAGATYHVILRGNHGQSIFSSEEDCSRFSFFMQEGIKQFEHSILAFCFMSNHVHLAIQVNEIPLSKICQNLAFRYAQFYNFKHDTFGHLFQGRYKAILVDDNEYLKELIRYIHLNPVRAKLVNDPLLYYWSSHQAYFNKDFAWLAKDILLRKFGETRFLAKQAFHHFVSSGIGVNCNIDFVKGFSDGILGNEDFIEEIKNGENYFPRTNPLDSLDLKKLVTFVTCWYGIDSESLLEGSEKKHIHVRAVIAFLVRKIKTLSFRDLVNFFGRKESGICHSARRLEVKIESSIELKNEIERLKTDLIKALK